MLPVPAYPLQITKCALCVSHVGKNLAPHP